LKKTKIYLTQKQQKSPSPLTPVEQAWDKMATLLDSEMPESKQKTKKRAITISFSQFVIFVMAAMVLVGGGTFLTIKTRENRKEIKTSNHSVKHPKPDSLMNKTVQIEDSAISIERDFQTSISFNQKVNEKVVLHQQQNNNQTSLSASTAQTTTQQKGDAVKKDNLKNKVADSSVITKTTTSQKVASVNISNLNNVFVDTNGTKINRSTNKTNPFENQQESTFTDSVNSQNNQPKNFLPKDENLAKVGLETKTILNDPFGTEIDSPIRKLPTKKEEIKEDRGSNYPKINHLFVGLSGNNGLLFSKNAGENIYSYGEIFTIGIRNTKYNLSVETGIGLQSLEYHVPYSRILYTYQTTAIYDSTTTVSSYKYSRRNVIIPFFITKEFFHYNNIFLDVKTGINTSIFLSKKRLFNQLPSDIQLVEDLYPITKLNFSFALSPQIRWDINEKFFLNINAGGIFYLNSLYSNYSVKPIGINFSAGLHYFF